MPMYTYRCNECGHEFETRQRFADDPLEECPVCNGRIRRVVNSVGVVFKGSGFYVTDNRNGSSKSSTAVTGSSTPDNSSEKSEKSDEKKSTTESSDTSLAKADTKPKESAKSTPAKKE